MMKRQKINRILNNQHDVTMMRFAMRRLSEIVRGDKSALLPGPDPFVDKDLNTEYYFLIHNLKKKGFDIGYNPECGK